MKLNLVQHSMKQFTLRRNNLLTEASDLMNRHLERIYDDACDVGFSVKLEGGEVVTMVMTEPFNKGEGEDVELGGWKYEISSESVRKFPHCAGMTATVFND